MSCCQSCDQKAHTLGLLGWTPNGFHGLGSLAATPAAPSATDIIGLVVNGVEAAGGIYLLTKKKHKHPVWGTVLLSLGALGIVTRVVLLATGNGDSFQVASK